MEADFELFRQKGKSAIATISKRENNINIIENWIFKITQRENKNPDSFQTEYIRNILQVVQDLKNGKDKNEVLNSIKKKQLGWKHTCFDEIRNSLQEQDDFVKNPFEIEEGALECRCGSKRVFSYSKQTRSCDEGMTFFITCLNCKNFWKQ